MNRRVWIAVAFLLLLSFQINVYADEGHNHGEGDYLKNAIEAPENTDGQPAGDEAHIKENHHSDPNGNVGTDSSNKHSNSMITEKGVNQMDHGDHGNAAEQEVDEGPNYKILGTFGAINLSFLLIDILNKWKRRKGE